MNLLVALALWLQEKTAEETFKKIEETIETAKTISVQFKFHAESKGAGEDQKMDASGSMVLKDANKAILSIKGLGKFVKGELAVISDGQRMRTKLGAESAVEKEAPKVLKSGLSTLLARTGICFAPIFSVRVSRRGENEVEPDPKNSLQVSDFKMGEDERAVKTLTQVRQFDLSLP